MNFTKAERNAAAALSFTLRKAGVYVTNSSLEKALLHHPDFPGIAAFPDVLAEWRVQAIVVRINEEQLSHIPLPAIAHLHTDGGMFAPVISVSQHEIVWKHTERGIVQEPIDTFLRKWTGVTLLMEASPQAGEADYLKNRNIEIRKKIRFTLAILITLFLCTFFLASSSLTVPITILLGIKVLGLIVTGLLSWYSIDSTNNTLRSICQFNNKTSCGNVLKSEGAHLIGGITWSDIGLIYFNGSFLALMWSIVTNKTAILLPGLFFLSCFSLPYTFYSIYYQAFQLKQWCVLCLTILALLWIEVVSGLSFGLPTNWESILLLIPSFALTSTIWMLLKPVFEKAMRIETLEKSLQRLKFDPVYIESLFSRQRYIPPAFDGMKIGRLGNPDASHTLIMVTSPTCQACASLHGALEKIISNLPDLQCHFVLVGTPEGEDGLVCRTILGLPENRISEALHDWFSHKKEGAHRWVKRYPTHSTATQQFNMHTRWAELAGVSNTPFLFLNGIELPTIYHTGELGKLCRILTTSEQVEK